MVPLCSVQVKQHCATTPKLLVAVEPAIPQELQDSPYAGKVSILVTVAKDGSVTDARVLEGLVPDVDEALLAAARLDRYEPGTMNGAAVATHTRVVKYFYGNLLGQIEDAIKVRDYSLAAVLCRRVLDINPDEVHALATFGNLLVASDPPQSEVLFRKVLQIDPKQPYAHNNLGKSLWNQHRYDEAAAAFRKQVEAQPEDVVGYHNLGVLLADQHRCSEAVGPLETSLRMQPQDPPALGDLARCRLDAGKTEEAVALYEKLLDVVERNALALNNVAYELLEHNAELDRALKYAQDAVLLEQAEARSLTVADPSTKDYRTVYRLSTFWDTLGWAYFKKGEYNTAIGYLQESFDLAPDGLVGDHLGQAFDRAKKPSEAIRAYADALVTDEPPTDTRSRLVALTGSEQGAAEEVRKATERKAHWGESTIAHGINSGAEGNLAILISGNGGIEQVKRTSGDAALEQLLPAMWEFKVERSAPEPRSNILRLARAKCDARGCVLHLVPALEALRLAQESEQAARMPQTSVGGVMGGVGASTPASVSKPPTLMRVRLSSKGAERSLVHKVQPVYPSVAKEARVEGSVVLQALIDENGQIKGLSVLSGHPLLVQAAMAAVKQWRYQPFLLNGKHVEVETVITVNFALGRR